MRCLLLCVFFCIAFAAEDAIADVKTRLKLYCMYTPQFQMLYERYFLPSIQDDFEVIARGYPQECPSGIFKSAGWEKTMLRKLELLHEAIQENWNDQIFIYSDIDLIFLRPALEVLLSHLGENDFVIQEGWPRNKICAGFFVMRGNQKTLKLITTAIRLLRKKERTDDQAAMQAALSYFKPGEIAWKFLPSEQFPNGRRVLKNYREESKQLYIPGSEITLDDSIILFHANCTLGLENKYHFLDRVQEEFLRKQSLDENVH